MKRIAGIEFMTRNETAEYLSISLSTLDALTHKARKGVTKNPIPFFQLKKNSNVLYQKDKLADWIIKQVK